MLNDPGKRLAAGLWKILAGLAILLLILSQYGDDEAQDGEQLPAGVPMEQN